MRVILYGLFAFLASIAAAQNVTASSLLSLLETTTTCVGCEAVLLVLKVLAVLGDDAFVNTITEVCVEAHLEDADVCKGAVGTEGPIIAHALRDMLIPSHTSQQFCTSFLGLCPYPDVRPYTVSFPEPKPNTTRPASSGQSPIQVVQFSDIHIDLEYETGSNYNCTKPICCRPYTAADAPGNTSYPCGPNGNHNCDTPVSLEESMYAAIEQYAPNASFALFTGDIPDHAIWLVNRSIVTNDIENAYTRMAAQLKMPIFATAGNHEAAPVNSFPPQAIVGATSSQWVYDTLSTAWTQWIGVDAASQADQYAAYSYKLPDANLRVISLDTNLYYVSNFWLFEEFMEYDPDGQLAWFVNELQDAENNNERVYVIGHMPFGLTDCFRDGSNYLAQIINRYEATIAAMFFGHTHLDHFELSYLDGAAPSSDTASMISYICPSLTPTSGSPAFRVYSVDPVTFGILDMTEYTTVLEDPSYQTTGPVWEPYYSSKAVYGPLVGVTDPTAELTPSFWHNVTEAFEGDDAAFQGYYARKRRGWDVSVCTGSCKTNEICGLRAAESQYNCAVPKPGLSFGKREVDGQMQIDVHADAGNLQSECHGSLMSEMMRKAVGRAALDRM